MGTETSKIMVDSKIFSVRANKELAGVSIFNHVKYYSVDGHGGNFGTLDSKIGMSFPYSEPMMEHGGEGEVQSASSVMNSEGLVKISDEPRMVASQDRPLGSLDKVSTDHGKGVEEHVGMDNLINDKSSLFSGAAASGDINSVPSLGDTVSSLCSKGNMDETEELSLG
ncbi:hypothetical protein Ancab_011876 [Ancistrocladus abbreviatus]